MIVPPVTTDTAPLLRPPENLEAARLAAENFEAQFIAEMLKYSGLNQTSSSFGGGPGEEAFASFLTEAYAKKITDAGGLGLSEAIYRAMVVEGETS